MGWFSKKQRDFSDDAEGARPSHLPEVSEPARVAGRHSASTPPAHPELTGDDIAGQEPSDLMADFEATPPYDPSSIAYQEPSYMERKSGSVYDSLSSGADIVQPFTIERFESTLHKQEVKTFRDEEGDLAASWENGVFFFMSHGEQNEILRIQARWAATLDQELLGEAINVCNRWNSDTLWPKAFATLNRKGRVVFMAEHNVDYEYGVSDRQIDLQLRSMISTGLQFFKMLSEDYPKQWEEFQAQQESPDDAE